MRTYFIRHTGQLDIDDATRRALWDAHKIGIHYPHCYDKTRVLRDADNESLKPDDYRGAARSAVKALVALARDGGYVCAQYAGQEQSLVGEVKPGSTIELVRGAWGSRSGVAPREAVLKCLHLDRARTINPSQSTAILVGRPRQGTLMRWPNAKDAIKHLVEETVAERGLTDLTTPQQETLCSEFLRLPIVAEFGLPQLAQLLLPVGRTMKDIDIYGVATDGRLIFGQVTYLEYEQTSGKRERLRQLRDATDSHRILFCRTAKPGVVDGVSVVSLDQVLAHFQTSASGQRWLSLSLPDGRTSARPNTTD